MGKLQNNILNSFQKQQTKPVTCFYWTVKVAGFYLFFANICIALHVSRSNEFQENAVIANKQDRKVFISFSIQQSVDYALYFYHVHNLGCNYSNSTKLMKNNYGNLLWRMTTGILNLAVLRNLKTKTHTATIWTSTSIIFHLCRILKWPISLYLWTLIDIIHPDRS